MTGSSNWIRRERRIACYIRAGFRCAYCERDLRNAGACEMGLDHLEDLVNGGGHVGANHASTNIVMACRSCNSSRRDTPLATWLARFPGAAERIEAERTALVNMDLARSLLAGEAGSDR